MDSQHLLINVICYLVAAVIAVPIFRKLGLGAILGYLAAGAFLGPQGLHFISEPEHALHFAEFGVVMLLFLIGLELNPEKLWQMRAQISFLGGGQLLLSALFIGAVVWTCLPLSLPQAAIVGLALALSSTAFAVQLMVENHIMALPLGRKGFSILLLQDMAVIPILLLLVAWAPQADTQHGRDLPWWIGFLALVVILFVGRFGLNPILRMVAQSGSRELLTAAALLIVLGTAAIMEVVGLSMGMGAFVAGILLANSSFRHQLEADIEPFKGLLLGLFFIAVGMNLDLQLLLEKPVLILLAALALMLVKTLVIALMASFRDCSWREGLLLGLMLSQGGEFAFVVMSKAIRVDFISQNIADHIIVIVGVSMGLTAPLVALLQALPRKAADTHKEYDVTYNEGTEAIIAGFGRFGQIIGRILSANHIPFAALDKDASHVEFVKGFGNKIYFGDATRLDLLEAAGLSQARVFVNAVENIEDSLQIVSTVRELYPDLYLIARAHNRAHAYQLYAAGANYVIREAVESSLVAASEALMRLGYTEGQALEKTELFRMHDENLIQQAVAHKDDQEQLLKIAQQGRKELEQLFNRDSSL